MGIFTAKGKGAMHSSTGGVQECAFPDPKRWTHCGLAKDIDYRTVPARTPDVIIQDIEILLDELRGTLK